MALAVAVGFAATTAAGSIIPFLTPLFAAQLLISGRRPLTFGQGLGMIVLIVIVGQILALFTALFGDRPLVFLSLLWFVYFTCFLLQASGKAGPAASLVLVIAILVPLLSILQRDLGEEMILILAEAVIGGVLLSWAAHALLADSGEDTAAPPGASIHRPASRQALASASILTAVVVLCLVGHRLSTAIVIPITVASLLGQLDLASTQRAAFGLMVVNLLGGIVATIAFTFLEVHPTLWLLFLIVLLISLLFGGRAAGDSRTGKAYGGALTIFLVLFGLGVSPLPVSTPELLSTRISYVFFGILWAIGMAALLWPRPQDAGVRG
ncbi:FUSC family protein [Geminicoccus flavidas]|uniref:FUSC family protein n=1 Tax=Geminicoccus flavidas TaxID=2506407 RepID=UPI00190F9366|nr:FUSC family protein [Geminicoccus flavidas]